MSGPPFDDVRMRGFRRRMDVADVLTLLASRMSQLSAETVSLLDAAGRVLAAAVTSSVNVPGFARAAMDGFALRASDTAEALPAAPRTVRLVGESLPGVPFAGQVHPGESVRIMTGAPIPAGADAVLMAELAEVEADGRILAREAVVPGKHVIRVGEDVEKGSTVLHAGRRLRPQDVGLLAAIGAASVQVVRQPRVAILVTGNELLPPGAMPTGFQIVDSNSPMLAALAARDGARVLKCDRVPDDFAMLRDAIRGATAEADVILVSGGTSVGREDHAPRVAAELGELAVHGVALRPAGPLGIGFLPRPEARGEEPNPPPPFPTKEGGGEEPTPPNPVGCLAVPVSGASRGPAAKEGGAEFCPSPRPGPRETPQTGPGTGQGGAVSEASGEESGAKPNPPPKLPLFLIPGNPVSCLCVYDLFVGRVVRRLGGRSWELPYRKARLPLASDIASAAGRVDYVRVKCENEKVVPLAMRGASNLSTAVEADGFLLVPCGRDNLSAGETVDVWLYDE